jgi:hypothetical protein
LEPARPYENHVSKIGEYLVKIKKEKQSPAASWFCRRLVTGDWRLMAFFFSFVIAYQV